MHYYQGPSSITRMFSKRGEQPIVYSSSSRQKVGYIGLVIPGTGELFTYECEVFNAETFTQALHEFERTHPCEKKRVIILDNASWHKKAVRLNIENATFADRHHYLFLPPYSPDLNPIERVWKFTRRYCTHNRYFPTIKHLREALTDFLNEFKNPNEELSHLCA